MSQATVLYTQEMNNKEGYFLTVFSTVNTVYGLHSVE